MKRLITLIVLVSATIAQVSSVTPSNETEQCPIYALNLTSISRHFGWVNSIYNVGQDICSALQAETTDEYLQDLSTIYETAIDGTFDPESLVPLVKQQAGAIAFLSVGLLVIIALPLSGLIFCCCRCCNQCGGRRKHRPSKCALCSHVITMVIGVSFVIAATSVYWISLEDTVDNVDDIVAMTTDIAQNLENVLSTAAGNVQCEVVQTMGVFFDDVQNTMQGIPDETFSKFEAEYGYNDMQMIINSIGGLPNAFNDSKVVVSIAAANITALAGKPWVDHQEVAKVTIEVQALDIALTEVDKNFEKVYSQLTNKFSEVDQKIAESKAKVVESVKTAQVALNETRKNIEQTSGKINEAITNINYQISNLTDSLQNIQHAMDESPIKDGVINGVRVLVLLPCALVIFPALIAITCGLFRLPADDSRPSKRPMVCRIGGCLSMTGVFFGFLLGWIVMLVATVFFLGGYGIEAVCKPMFHDSQMRALKYIPQLNFEIPAIVGPNSTQIGFGEVLVQCSQGSSIFTALEGESIMDVDAILKQADLEKYKQDAINEFSKQNLTYSFPADPAALLRNATDVLNVALSNFETSLPKTVIAAGNNTQKLSEVEIVESMLAQSKSACDNLLEQINGMLGKVDELIEIASNSSQFTSKGTVIITDIFDTTITDVTGKVYEAKDHLLNDTFDCYPLSEVWQQVGSTMCDVVGKPLQGIWASAGLAALFLIVTIIPLAIAAKYLQQMKSEYDHSSGDYNRENWTMNGAIQRGSDEARRMAAYMSGLVAKASKRGRRGADHF